MKVIDNVLNRWYYVQGVSESQDCNGGKSDAL